MNKRELNIAKNQVIKSIAIYLKLNGWKSNFESKDQSAIFNYIDPVTGISHRSDFAYFIQSEREIYNLLK